MISKSMPDQTASNQPCLAPPWVPLRVKAQTFQMFVRWWLYHAASTPYCQDLILVEGENSFCRVARTENSRVWLLCFLETGTFILSRHGAIMRCRLGQHSCVVTRNRDGVWRMPSGNSTRLLQHKLIHFLQSRLIQTLKIKIFLICRNHSAPH